MASTSTNYGAPEDENFEEFLTKWKEKQNRQLDELIDASKISHPPPKDPFMCALVQRVIAHYEEFYKVKSSCAEGNVFPALSPPWNSPMEDAFTWVGGWRPTVAIQLLYSVSGLQLESKMRELRSSLSTHDLSDLSLGQITRIDTLHGSTVKEEREISEEEAKQQEKAVDAEMVELSQDMSESSRRQEVGDSDRVESTLKPKEKGFERILIIADDLRMRTLKCVIGILSPIQAIHFLINTAELQLKLNEWGKEKEEMQIAALLQHPTTTEAS